MQLGEVTQLLDVVKKSDESIVVLEVEVLRQTRFYKIIGVYMDHTSEVLRIAFNAKNNAVMDDVDIFLHEIQTVRVVQKEEIEVLE